MRICWLLFALCLALIGGKTSAQEAKSWLGANVLGVTKAETDKLRCDGPCGAKVGVVASGSPAEEAGLKSGDIILAVDRAQVDSASDVDTAIAAKRPAEELRLQVLSDGSERRITVTVAERPNIEALQDQALPLLMFDPGGHTGLIERLEDYVPVVRGGC